MRWLLVSHRHGDNLIVGSSVYDPYTAEMTQLLNRSRPWFLLGWGEDLVATRGQTFLVREWVTCTDFDDLSDVDWRALDPAFLRVVYGDLKVRSEGLHVFGEVEFVARFNATWGPL